MDACRVRHYHFLSGRLTHPPNRALSSMAHEKVHPQTPDACRRVFSDSTILTPCAQTSNHLSVGDNLQTESGHGVSWLLKLCCFPCRPPGGPARGGTAQLGSTLHICSGRAGQLVTDRPVEVQDCRKITDHCRGIYRIYPNIIKGETGGCQHVTGWTCKH